MLKAHNNPHSRLSKTGGVETVILKFYELFRCVW